MGNRLSKIVTRTGDAGTTGLGDGSRVDKDCLRIDSMGEVDELNSSLGVLLAEELPPAVRDALLGIQHDLFDLGGELCIPGTSIITEEHIVRLEDLVTHFNASLSPLKEFILPGGTRAAALAHLSRTVCRRAERRVVHLATTCCSSSAAPSTRPAAVAMCCGSRAGIAASRTGARNNHHLSPSFSRIAVDTARSDVAWWLKNECDLFSCV